MKLDEALVSLKTTKYQNAIVFDAINAIYWNDMYAFDEFVYKTCFEWEKRFNIAGIHLITDFIFY